MTTATAPAPWDEADAKRREAYARRDAALQWQNLSELSEDDLRGKLAQIEAAKEELANIDEIIAATQAKIDEAADEHARITGPLQVELNSAATPASRKVQLREAVILANEKLEATIDSLNKSLKAAEQQREITRSIVGGKTALENAWVLAAPAAERARVMAIRQALDLLKNNLEFAWLKRVAESQATIDIVKQKIAKNQPADDGRGGKWRVPGATFADLELIEMEGKHKHLEAVANIIYAWRLPLEHELDETRRQRLAELYR